VAAEFRRRYGVNARVAFRLAHGWSQRQAADRWNERWPADPKTFKNISYWENWPSSTGYEPSLDVLARLADVYECSVADLLADYADFRHQDANHAARQQLQQLPATVNAGGPGLAILTTLGERLKEIDVHELARMGAAWAQQLDGDLDRRALLLKLSAGLTLAAAMPVIADDDSAVRQATESASETDHRLAGIWHSRYIYQSSGRGGEFAGEHYVVLRTQNGRLVGQSLPHSTDSLLRLELSVEGSVATGTWSERTSPTGYYKGAVYHGTLQLLIDPMGRSMSGKWLGYSKNFRVNDGEWELTWVEGSTSRRAMREYHLKV
jgi:transcriptional regulator with XRE-family HTH domain